MRNFLEAGRVCKSHKESWGSDAVAGMGLIKLSKSDFHRNLLKSDFNKFNLGQKNKKPREAV